MGTLSSPPLPPILTTSHDLLMNFYTDIPEQPQNVRAVGVGSREVNLTWVEPHDNNAPISGYQVTYMQPEFVTGERERVVNTSAVEMATITGLFPGVDYMFKVIAYNEIGPSIPSDPLTVRTLDEGEGFNGSLTVNELWHFTTAPTSPPDNVMVMVVSSTAIMVTWDMVPAMNRNGIITVYEVQYEPLEMFDDTTLTVNMSGSATMTCLTGLQEFVDYDISVRAYTSEGEGPYSTVVTEMTAEDGK